MVLITFNYITTKASFSTTIKNSFSWKCSTLDGYKDDDDVPAEEWSGVEYVQYK